MKTFFIFLLLVFISLIESRRHNDYRYDIDSILNSQYNHKRRPNTLNNAYGDDERDEDADTNDDADGDANDDVGADENNDDDDQYAPLRRPHEKYPSPHKSFSKTKEDANDDDDDGDDDDNHRGDSGHRNDPQRLLTSSSAAAVAASEKPVDIPPEVASCLVKYDIEIQQLVKVKELKNGAHLIRHEIVENSASGVKLNPHDSCMLSCCREKTCDLAMLGEQASRDGHKCYLFSCNGSCPLAPHEDYTVMIPKNDATLYRPATKATVEVTSTALHRTVQGYALYCRTTNNIKPKANVSRSTPIFREVIVILSLIFGVICTIVLFVVLYLYCRQARRRGRGKNYAVDADYLINGLYL